MTRDVNAIIDFIWDGEADGDPSRWEIGAPAGFPPPTELTVGAILELQKQGRQAGKELGAGAIQVQHDTLIDLVEMGAVSLTDTFDEATQRRATEALMGKRGLADWLNGRMSTEEFGTNLAQEWASLPVLQDTYRAGNPIPRGNGFYGGVSTNPSNYNHRVSGFEAALGSVSGTAQGASGTVSPTAPPPTTPPVWSASSVRHLQGVDPRLVEVLVEARARTGIPFEIADGYRTEAEQRDHIANGRSQTMNSHHLHGGAIDILIPDGNGGMVQDFEAYRPIADAAKAVAQERGYGDFVWGGDWQTLKDGVHFQMASAQGTPPPDGGAGTGFATSTSAGELPQPNEGRTSGPSPAQANPGMVPTGIDQGTDDALAIAPRPLTGLSEGLSPTGNDDTPFLADNAQFPRLQIPYSTPGASGGAGPVQHGGFFQSVGDEAQDGYIARGLRQAWQGRNDGYDPQFDAFGRALQDGQYGHLEYLSQAGSQNEYVRLTREIEYEGLRDRRRQAYTGWGAPLLGSAINPDSLVMMAIPGAIAGKAGMGVLRSGLRSATVTAAFTLPASAALEAGRRSTLPQVSDAESLLRVGGDVLLAGAMGGLVGSLSGARLPPDLAGRYMNDLGASWRRGVRSEKVDVGDAQVDIEWGGTPGGAGPNPSRMEGAARAAGRASAKAAPHVRGAAQAAGRGGKAAARAARRAAVRTAWEIQGARDIAAGLKKGGGVFFDRVSQKMRVDEDALRKRWKAGERPGGAQTFDEFVEHEIGATAAKVRGLKAWAKGFWGSQDGAIDFGWGRSDGGVDAGGSTLSEIQAALGAGKRMRFTPARGRFGDLEVDGKAFGSAREVEEFDRALAHEASASVDEADFRARVQKLLDRLEERTGSRAGGAAEAERAGTEGGALAVRAHRERLNKVLENRWLEGLARMADGPYKRIHRGALTNKLLTLVDQLAHDGGFRRPFDGTEFNPGPSVYSRSKTWDGLVQRLADKEKEQYAKYLGIEDNKELIPGVRTGDFKRTRADGGKPMSIEEFRERATEAHILNSEDAISEINAMVPEIRRFYAEFEAVGEPLGVISAKRSLQQQKAHLNTMRRNHRPSVIEGDDPVIADLDRRIEDLDDRIAHAEHEPGKPHYSRIWNREAIKQNRDFFREQIVKPWMGQQPWVGVYAYGQDEFQQVLQMLIDRRATPQRIEALRQRMRGAPPEGRWEWVRASTEPAAVHARAEKMIDDLLEEADDDMLLLPRDPDKPVFGRHRVFDIPNEPLLKNGFTGNGTANFIEMDYLMVGKTYSDRMAPGIEMARTFARPVDGVSAADGFKQAMSEAREAELDQWKADHAGSADGFADHWAPMERDLLHLKDRVLNRVIRNPERWDNRSATVLRQWAQVATMGMAALPAVQEVGAIIMRHGIAKTFRAATHKLDDGMAAQMRIARQELEAAGGLLDAVSATQLASFAETGFEAAGKTRAERWLRAGSGRYFMWNGLAPMTMALKRLDAGVRVHAMTDLIDQVGRGEADETALAELGRWGITPSMARRMSDEPMFLTEEGHWNPNTESWGDEDLVRAYRSMIRQGSENTILMATAADKPIMVDGAAYIRRGARVDDYAKRLGLEQVGDYWRVQSGLMTLPFTFWNYGFASLNKILIAGLDEPSARAASGMAAIFGLSYMVAQLRGGETWDKLPLEDRIARAVDQSGMAGVVPQYLNLGQQTVMGATGNNPLPWKPKGMPAMNLVDAAFVGAGAGPQVARDGIGGLLSGDMGQASMAAPGQNHFLKVFWDSVTDGVARAEAGQAAA